MKQYAQSAGAYIHALISIALEFSRVHAFSGIQPLAVSSMHTVYVCTKCDILCTCDPAALEFRVRLQGSISRSRLVRGQISAGELKLGHYLNKSGGFSNTISYSFTCMQSFKGELLIVMSKPSQLHHTH